MDHVTVSSAELGRLWRAKRERKRRERRETEKINTGVARKSPLAINQQRSAFVRLSAFLYLRCAKSCKGIPTLTERHTPTIDEEAVRQKTWWTCEGKVKCQAVQWIDPNAAPTKTAKQRRGFIFTSWLLNIASITHFMSLFSKSIWSTGFKCIL